MRMRDGDSANDVERGWGLGLDPFSWAEWRQRDG